MNLKRKNLILLTGFVIALLVLACGCTGTDEPATTKGTVTIGYVTWDSEIASTNVLAEALQDAGYDVELQAVDAGPLYQALANGDVDCSCSAWLPATHENYWNKYGDSIDMAGKNLQGAKIGLVVPTYVTIDSIDELNTVSDQFDGKIIGIEPGAGIMQNTEEAIEAYGLDYTLVPSSSAGMAAELTSAYDEERWVVVTGWTPHWKFARFDLKYLKDPQGIYGGEEYIGTLTRTGLDEENPELYAILERFSWTPADMESVMLDIEQGTPEKEAARNWINANQATVDQWLGTS